jgi:hypothetical protein
VEGSPFGGDVELARRLLRYKNMTKIKNKNGGERTERERGWEKSGLGDNDRLDINLPEDRAGRQKRAPAP